MPSLLAAGRPLRLEQQPWPLALDDLLPGEGAWEMELGFGKGRYLLAQAARRPGVRFLGIEVASRYFRLAARRCQRRRLHNVVLLRGEALYLMATALPPAFARVVHVYFPDPWPKSRHQKRRIFDPETLDLLLACLVPGGLVCFATDHGDYGAAVVDLLRRHPAVDLECLDGPWPEGPRTNYEAKYVRQGRPIVRLEARLLAARQGEERAGQLLHPDARRRILVGPREAAAGASE